MFEIIFIITVIFPIAIALGGFFLRYHAPADIDNSLGFRTKRALSSKEAYSFANRKCGSLWLIGGIIAFLISTALQLLFYMIKGEYIGSYIGILMLILQIVAFIFSIVTVEKKLRLLFDNKK